MVRSARVHQAAATDCLTKLLHHIVASHVGLSRVFLEPPFLWATIPRGWEDDLEVTGKFRYFCVQSVQPFLGQGGRQEVRSLPLLKRLYPRLPWLIM